MATGEIRVNRRKVEAVVRDLQDLFVSLGEKAFTFGELDMMLSGGEGASALAQTAQGLKETASELQALVARTMNACNKALQTFEEADAAAARQYQADS